MRILLADPPRKETYYHAHFPNLGVLYLVSSLRKKFGAAVEVRYLDGHRDLAGHLAAVDSFRPDLYGLSFATMTRVLSYRVIREIKALHPGMPVVCGGAMPSAAPVEVLANAPADVCVRGEGEEAVCDLAEHFRGGRGRLENIPGLVFRSASGEIVESPPRRPAADLDALAPPDWEDIDLRRYAGWHISRAEPQAILLASRGCPYNCVYCSNPVWKYAKPWVRLRSPESIAREVRRLHELGAHEIYLSADELNVEENWALEVCRAIAGLGLRGLYFNTNVRPDVMTAELARAFRSINLWLVHLGIESGNQRTLDGVGKNVRLEQITSACRLLKAQGVKVFGFVMLYHAWEEGGRLCWEDARDVDRTLAFCRRLFRAGLMDYMSWQVATPMPGSRLWDIALRHRLLTRHDIRSMFSRNLNLPGVSDRDVRRSLRKGLWLKGLSLARAGQIHPRHLTAVWANLKVLLGLGPPRGAY